MKKIAAAVALLLVSTAAHAVAFGPRLPVGPAPVRLTENALAADNVLLSPPTATAPRLSSGWRGPADPSTRAEFRNYALASMAALAGDMLTIANCKDGCREASWSFGDSGTERGLTIATRVALDAVALALADRYRVSHPGSNKWKLIPAALMTAHGVGIGVNLRR